jgi:hypothetical protein
MTTAPSHDSRYYDNAAKLGINRRLSHAARVRNYKHFEESMRPTAETEILDLGTCDEITSEANMLQQMHPHRTRITCASLGEGASILAAYPGVRHVRITAGALPFSDGQFEIGFSNAVLEHVGNVEAQAAFVRELCRVSRRVYLAVPNRLFPVEHHTCLPLVHWLPKPWFRALLRRTRFAFYGREENLNHASARQLRAWFPENRRPKIAYTGIGFGVFRSNLVAYEA